MAAGVPAGGSGDVGNQELAHVGGNPNLKAETAKIFTAGLVFQPQMVRNLTVTVDYYHITVDDPIGTIGLPTILNACYPGSGGTPFQQYCSQVTRSTDDGSAASRRTAGLVPQPGRHRRSAMVERRGME